jgi:hypothetical protein
MTDKLNDNASPLRFFFLSAAARRGRAAADKKVEIAGSSAVAD